ncbi:MAG: hypothetical protein ACI86H_000590 [bacterium]|jgi:hypothetical protein
MIRKTYFFLIVMTLFFRVDSYSNPFSAKIESQTKKIPLQQKKIKILSHGIIFWRNDEYAFLQIGKEDFVIQKGNEIEQFKILDIFKKYIVLQYKEEIIKVYHNKIHFFMID